MGTRVCRYCGKEKDIEDYEEANTIKGKKYRRWRCHNCYMALKLVRRHKIKDWFIELKKTFSCKECGEDRYYMLDLHHRDPGKKDMCLSNAIRGAWSKKRILKEVEKCDVYCANCHREFHHLQK